MVNIENILNEKLQEGQHLEYKDYYFENGKFNSLGQKQKNTLAKEICAFANAEGGTIVIGISEDKNHNPTEYSDTGVNQETFEQWEQSFRLFCKSKIRPVVHGIKCKLIDKDGNNLISIEVPKSIIKPHAFYDGNRDDFFIRYGNICNHMNYDDLKKAFTELESIQNKIIRFRDNRISMILNGDVAGNIEDKAVLIIHIIPNWSMGVNSYVDFRKVEHEEAFDVFSPIPLGSGRRGMTLYNADGIMVNYGYGDFPIMSYTQLFHNGSIESTEVRLMNYQPNNLTGDMTYIYKWFDIEELSSKKIYQFCSVLEEINVPKPYNVFVSILNGKGKETIIDSFGEISEPLPRDIIKSLPAYLDDDSNFEEAIYPLLTSLANAFGLKKSFMYDENNNPIKEKFDFIKG